LKIQIIIDGHLVHVNQGTTVLQAAKKAGIAIPTLCYHEALKPYGGCRLCMVEILQNKRRRLVTSCTFPAGAGMEVFSDTARVKAVRRKVVELLLSRCPDEPLLQKMAKHMGIEHSEFRNREDKECILCGLCVRFCEEVVGVKAIGLSNRGVECEVATPFKKASEACIGCGSCTYICPTGCIEMQLDNKSLRLHTMQMGRLSHLPCTDDGRCESCDADLEFMNDIKEVLTQFRNKFNDKG
jgi:NADH dehydrogenase/NADH:ubiquinone oxidoreductase subunit G